MMLWNLRIAAAVGVACCVFAGCSDKGTSKTPSKGSTAKGAAAKGAAAKGAAAKGQAAPGGAKGKGSGKAGLVAVVNGVEISQEEFDRKYSKMTKAFTTRSKDVPASLAGRYKDSILKQLVDKELLRQKIAAEKITVEAEELDTAFEDYKKMFRTEENFQRYLKNSKVDVNSIRENVKHNLSVKKLLAKSEALDVPEEEATKYYEDHKDRYSVKEQVRASHILFKVAPKKGAAPKKGDDKADAKAKKAAMDVYKQAKKKGADFAELAKKHSQGPTAKRGGDLNFFSRGRMVKEFDEVAFKMKVGEVSKPIRTQFGWHVIKVTDRKEARQRPFEEVRDSITKNLQMRKQRKAKLDLLKDLRETATIERYLPATPKPKKKAATTAPVKLKLNPAAAKSIKLPPSPARAQPKTP